MLFLAVRHLLARKKQTSVILFGISLGTMIYVAISGIQLGFRAYFIDKLINNNAHISISGREEYISSEDVRHHFLDTAIASWIVPPSGKRENARIMYPQGWFARLNQHPDVVAYAPQIHAQAIFRRNNIRVAAQIVGIDVEKQKHVTNLTQDISEGKLEAISSGGGRIVVGSGLARKLGTRLGETVHISTGTGDAVPYKVVGIYHSGVQQLDDSIAYGHILNIQQLAGTPGRVTNIAVKLNDISQAVTLAEQWSLASQDHVQNWEQANESILQVFRIQDFIRNFITVAVLMVAGFGIYNVLSIIINQKKREIAILRTLGFSPGEIQKLYLSQGAILGITGSLFGLLFGFLACKAMENVSFKGAGFDKVSISYDPALYIYGIIMATVAALAAGYFPSRSAKRMTPVDIIRSEG